MWMTVDRTTCFWNPWRLMQRGRCILPLGGQMQQDHPPDRLLLTILSQRRSPSRHGSPRAADIQLSVPLAALPPARLHRGAARAAPAARRPSSPNHDAACFSHLLHASLCAFDPLCALLTAGACARRPTARSFLYPFAEAYA